MLHARCIVPPKALSSLIDHVMLDDARAAEPARGGSSRQGRQGMSGKACQARHVRQGMFQSLTGYCHLSLVT